LAWIFIIFGGFSIFISILQNIMIFLVFPRQEMKQKISEPGFADQIPAFVQFIFSHMEMIFLLVLIILIVSFVSAIALLKRKNWARIVFIVLFSLGILWNIGGLIAQLTFFNFIPEAVRHNQAPGFETMRIIMMIASVIIVLAVSTLFGWIIKKLLSEPIKEEFT